jgi:hypothetical protein
VPRTFQDLNVFLRTVVWLGFVLLACWWTIFLKGKLAASEHLLEERQAELDTVKSEFEKRGVEMQALDAALKERAAEVTRLEQVKLDLEKSVAEKQRAIEALEFAKSLLEVSHRVARIEVLAQQAPPEALERVRTTVRFTELGPDGASLAPGQELTIEGKTLYVESLVIQFEDRYVEQGDALRGTSLCFFKRLFGENQSPSEGPPLDAAGQQPLAYGGDTTLDPVHRALWQRFWDYANDPALAREVGVRALQGEAPFIEARPGKTYRLDLRASGGLVIQAE